MNKTPNPLPTQEKLQALLNYDPRTGILIWRKRPVSRPQDKAWNLRYAGKPALTASHIEGYRRGMLLGINVLAHRVAFKWFHGSEPDEIDHIDGNQGNNSIRNLRGASRSLNSKNLGISRNNTSGVTGVRSRPAGKFAAEIQVGGKRRYIGRFETIEAATIARKQAEKEFGFHENHGRTNTETHKKEARNATA